METNVNWMQQGWECPKCGAVMSPTTSCCVNCRGNKGGGTATTSPTAINGDPIWNDPSSICSTSSPLDPPYMSTRGSHDEWWEKAQLNGYRAESHASPASDSFKYKTEN